VLGFLEKPHNSVILRPEYTPSKVGGQPAYIWPEDTPAPVCADCGYFLTFLAQIYANINDKRMDDYHRMLYVFLCVSEKCIGTQRAVRVFRCIVPHANDKLNFDDEGTYFDIQHKTDN
jgi:pre-rRNA-processing protein TSR4